MSVWWFVYRQPLWRAWCRFVKRIENHNHPYAMRYRETGIDCEDTHWGPISERVCAVADFLTMGDAHD